MKIIHHIQLPNVTNVKPRWRSSLTSANSYLLQAVNYVKYFANSGGKSTACFDLNEQIKKHTAENTEANLIAHALLGAVEAVATGNNALAGVAAGARSEAVAMVVAKQLYNKKPSELTEAEKQNVVFLSQLAGGLAAGMVGDNSQSTAVGAEIGKRAVENNGLLDSQVSDLFKDLEKAEKEGHSLEEIFTQYKELSDKQYREFEESFVDSTICRFGAEKLLDDANQKAFELVGFFNSRLSTLSEPAQEKFIEFVITENAKEIESINGARTPVEKAVVLLVDAFVESRENQGAKISPKISGFYQKTKKEQLRENKQAGDDFEKLVLDRKYKEGYKPNTQVTLKTQSGVKTKVDIISIENGKVICTECKSSETAPLTKNQAKAFPKIEKNGAVVVGKGRPDFPGGTVIEPTKVIIERKANNDNFTK